MIKLWLFMKQNHATMTKTIGDTKVKHFSLLILKISFLTLFGCGVKIHQINPIFWYWVKITPDINPIHMYMVWLTCPDDLKKVWQLYIDLMLLVISLLTLLKSVGCNIPLILTQYVVRWVGLVLRFLTICLFIVIRKKNY